MFDSADLEKELNKVYAKLTSQEDLIAAFAVERGIPREKVLHPDGTQLMMPVLTAKAQVLSALQPLVVEREKAERAKRMGERWAEMFGPKKDE